MLIFILSKGGIVRDIIVMYIYLLLFNLCQGATMVK
jgi:hypothetical protein